MEPLNSASMLGDHQAIEADRVMIPIDSASMLGDHQAIEADRVMIAIDSASMLGDHQAIEADRVMIPIDFDSTNFDIQLLPEYDQESSHSQTLHHQMLSESNDSLMKSDDSYKSDRCFVDEIDGSKEGTEICPCCSKQIVKTEHGDIQTKEYKLARALALVTLQEFNNIYWRDLGDAFHNYFDELYYFIDEVFKAMAWFVWNLYDEEDFENIAYHDDIFDECKRIQKLVDSKENFELDSSLLDIRKYEKVREHDICNLFKWCNENKSPYDNELTEFLPKWAVLLNQVPHQEFGIDLDYYVDLAKTAMVSYDNLDPKGIVKQQLRMELNDRKCFCIVDALYMQSWKRMNFQKLEELVPGQPELEHIHILVHLLFHDFVETRIQWLHNYQNLVTYPLSCNKFGSWDNEAVEVVKRADLKRRSEGRRFIGTDHLIFCLHQMLVCEILVCESSKVSMPTDVDDKHKDTVYHVYRRAYEIATKLGHEMIGLEHIYAAITTVGDDKRCWKDSVEGVRMAKANRKGENEDLGHKLIGLDKLLAFITTSDIDSDDESSWKCPVERVRKAECEEMDEPYPLLWSRFFTDGNCDSVIELAKEIQDQSSTVLQNDIYDRLFRENDRYDRLLRFYEPLRQMIEGEMIKSLKKNIEISSKPPKSFAAHFAVVMFLAVGTCRFMQHIAKQ